MSLSPDARAVLVESSGWPSYFGCARCFSLNRLCIVSTCAHCCSSCIRDSASCSVLSDDDLFDLFDDLFDVSLFSSPESFNGQVSILQKSLKYHESQIAILASRLKRLVVGPFANISPGSS